MRQRGLVSESCFQTLTNGIRDGGDSGVGDSVAAKRRCRKVARWPPRLVQVSRNASETASQIGTRPQEPNRIEAQEKLPHAVSESTGGCVIPDGLLNG